MCSLSHPGRGQWWWWNHPTCFLFSPPFLLKKTNQQTPGLNASDLTSSNLLPALGLHLSASLVCTVLCSNGAMHIHFALHQATADLAFSVAPIRAPNSELVVPLGNVKVTRCPKRKRSVGSQVVGMGKFLVRWRPEVEVKDSSFFFFKSFSEVWVGKGWWMVGGQMNVLYVYIYIHYCFIYFFVFRVCRSTSCKKEEVLLLNIRL